MCLIVLKKLLDLFPKVSRPFYSCRCWGWPLHSHLILSVFTILASGSPERSGSRSWPACMTISLFLGDRRMIVAAPGCLPGDGWGSSPAMCKPAHPLPPILRTMPHCSCACLPASCLLECVSLNELGECDTAVGIMVQKRAPVLIDG